MSLLRSFNFPCTPGRCRALVRFLATAPSSLVFRKPVDTTLFTDYYQYVEEPIDLRTVDRRLEGSE